VPAVPDVNMLARLWEAVPGFRLLRKNPVASELRLYRAFLLVPGSNSPATCVRGSSGCWRGGEQLRSCQQVDGCMFGCSIDLLRQRVTYLQKE
jgi:hypothetical protein